MKGSKIINVFLVTQELTETFPKDFNYLFVMFENFLFI